MAYHLGVIRIILRRPKSCRFPHFLMVCLINQNHGFLAAKGPSVTARSLSFSFPTPSVSFPDNFFKLTMASHCRGWFQEITNCGALYQSDLQFQVKKATALHMMRKTYTRDMPHVSPSKPYLLADVAEEKKPFLSTKIKRNV